MCVCQKNPFTGEHRGPERNEMTMKGIGMAGLEHVEAALVAEVL